MGNGKVPAY